MGDASTNYTGGLITEDSVPTNREEALEVYSLKTAKLHWAEITEDNPLRITIVALADEKFPE